LPEAERHLHSVFDYYAIKSESVASNIFNDILDAIEGLKQFPEKAAKEPLLDGFVVVFRSLVVRKHYKIIYFINYDMETVFVVAIWDCRQNPNNMEKFVENSII
jgi:plasmid stabilization system protein ParE